MLAAGEGMMVEPANELQALLADYEMFVSNGGAIADGDLAPVGLEPLDGQIAQDIPIVNDADVLVATDMPVIDATPAPPAPDAPAPTDAAPTDMPSADPAPADPMSADAGHVDPTAPADPAPPVDPVVPTTVGSIVEGGAGDNRFDVSGMSANYDDLGRILDFTQGQDMLHFGGAVAASPDNFVATMAASYDEARLEAIRLIEGGQADYVAVQIGDDTVVFGDNGTDTVDSAVVLANHRVTDVNMFDIG